MRDTSEDCALRARQLTEPTSRKRIACSLRGVVGDAENPRAALLGSTAPVRSNIVVLWREALLGLAERLEQTDSLNSLGLARAQVLLTDGTGPLYDPASRQSLGEAIWWIADGLQPCLVHDWRCPVRVKLDPAHVAWTCAHCGAITTTSDPAARPA